MRRLTTILVAATFLALPIPTALGAGGGAAAVQDCQDGKIDGTYTAAEYREALASIPTDVDEYTDCRAVLRAAQLRAAGAPASASSARTATAPGAVAPGVAAVGAPVGDVTPPAGAPAPSADPAAPSQAAAGGTPAQAPGTAPPPRIPGLPVDGGPVVAGSTPGLSPLPTVVASRAAEEVPPTLALLLVLSAGGLLTLGALRVRRSRRAVG